MLAVVPVETVLFVAPLFAVLPMGAPGPNARRVYVLNDDIYAHFDGRGGASHRSLHYRFTSWSWSKRLGAL